MGILTASDPLEGNRAADSAGNFYFIDNAHLPLAAGNARPPFDVIAVRRDFPILGERVNGKPLVWFDKAATTQKPQSVIDRLAYFYAHENSNIHRAAHELAARATDAYEAARGKVQRFLGAGSADRRCRRSGAALDYVDRIGLENIARYEHGLLTYAMHGLGAIPGVRLIGTATDKACVASFVLAGYQPEEVGKALNQEGIAVRSGHHCAQPILRRFGVEATVRPSLAFYNTCEEIDRLLSVVRHLAQAKGGAVRSQYAE